MYLIDTFYSRTPWGKIGSFFLVFGVAWALLTKFRWHIYLPVLGTESLWLKNPRANGGRASHSIINNIIITLVIIAIIFVKINSSSSKSLAGLC